MVNRHEPKIIRIRNRKLLKRHLEFNENLHSTTQIYYESIHPRIQIWRKAYFSLYHYVREAVSAKEINLEYFPTQDMIADPMTKGLPRPQPENLRLELGVLN